MRDSYLNYEIHLGPGQPKGGLVMRRINDDESRKGNPMRRLKELGERDVERIAEKIWCRVSVVDFTAAVRMAERIATTLNAVRSQPIKVCGHIYDPSHAKKGTPPLVLG